MTATALNIPHLVSPARLHTGSVWLCGKFVDYLTYEADGLTLCDWLLINLMVY